MSTKVLVNLDFGSVGKPVNLAAPSANADAATKQYVDNAVAGISNPKVDVKAVANANINLATNGLAAIDGYTPAANDRILLTAQTTTSQNGIWLAQSGAWTRPTDFASASVQNGCYVFCTGGSTFVNTGWLMTGTTAVTVDTTAETWVQFTGLGDVSTGAGLQKVGNQISMITPLGKYTSAIGDGSSTTITKAHGLGTAIAIAQVVDTSGNVVECDIQITSVNVVLTFASAPASNAYTVIVIG